MTGINDSPSLTNSDVGISVDSAVDIAKEAADIILLEKDLNVLLDGVTEGRRTFVNLMKYIKLATSFNFGEVISVIIASVLLPFLPETPIQLLMEGLLYDFGQMTLPFDNVDKEALNKPKSFSLKSLKEFMLFMGPLSSAFDMLVFAALWFIFKVRDVATFQTIWFSYSITSNLIGMHIIRTAKLPFIESNAHKAVYISSISLIAARNNNSFHSTWKPSWTRFYIFKVYFLNLCCHNTLLLLCNICQKNIYQKIWRMDMKNGRTPYARKRILIPHADF